MKASKIEPKKIGMIGSHDVVDYGRGVPCLRFDQRTTMGATKIKAVLANLEVARKFLIEYDKPKATKAVEKPVETPAPATVDLAKQLEDLRAQLAALQPAAVVKSEPKAGRFAAK